MSAGSPVVVTRDPVERSAVTGFATDTVLELEARPA